jgi:hypothetical protein
MLRERARFLLPAALLTLVATGTAFAQQAVPGYQLLTAPQVSGGILVNQRQNATSATQLLLQGFREVATFFDGSPRAVGGFRDASDQYAEVGFQGTIRGVSVSGVALALTLRGTGAIAFAFDTPNTLPQSLPRLFAFLSQGQMDASGCPPPGINWQVVRYPDGSGQVALPAGWGIASANRGTLDAQGPHGRAVVAFAVPVLTRAAAAQKRAFQRQISSQIGVALPEAQVFVADPTEPGEALVAVHAQLSALNQQLGLRASRMLRVIQTTPIPWQGVIPGKAGLVHFEFEEGGLVQQALAYVILGLLDPEQWLYWQTAVAAPSVCFAQNLPTLVKIASSAQTADHIIQGNLDRAAQSLQEAQEIQWQTYQSRQRTEQRGAALYTETFRGTRVIEDMATGTRTTVDLAHSDEIVRRLNQQYGPDRFREIRAGDLN